MSPRSNSARGCSGTKSPSTTGAKPMPLPAAFAAARMSSGWLLARKQPSSASGPTRASTDPASAGQPASEANAGARAAASTSVGLLVVQPPLWLIAR
jgi:hypothetical protein